MLQLHQFTKYTLLLHFAAVLVCVSTAPQQAAPTNPNLEALVNDIFQTNPSTPPRRGGFDTVVTPEPLDPSQPQQQFQSISGRTCNCVPYHLCDPATDTVIEDGEFDGFGLIDIRFNRDDPVCEHFLDKCCGTSHTHNTSLTPKPQEERPERPVGCGVRNVGGIDFTITGAKDNEAGFGEFPWTVALLHAQNFSYFCTGSLIHPRVVLTAVHCVIGRAVNSFIVRAGEWDTQTDKERLPYQELSVQRVITHPNYNPRNVAFDFALVILSDSFTIGDHINVVCLPPQSALPQTGTTCYSTGWGKDIFGAAGRYSAIMKRVPLPIVEFNDCQTKFRATRLGPKFALDQSFVCAGGVRGIDTCQGDGGAPLSCPISSATPNRYHQSGIVAWGIGCNDEIPAAYANVATARNWIDQQMQTTGYGTASYTPY